MRQGNAGKTEHVLNKESKSVQSFFNVQGYATVAGRCHCEAQRGDHHTSRIRSGTIPRMDFKTPQLEPISTGRPECDEVIRTAQEKYRAVARIHPDFCRSGEVVILQKIIGDLTASQIEHQKAIAQLMAMVERLLGSGNG